MTRLVLAACCAALLGISAGTPALGAERGWYLGGGAGYASASFDDDSIRSEVARQSPGSSGGTISKDEDSVLYKIFLGYSFTSFIALEANAFWLNDFAFNVGVSPAGQMTGDVDYWGFSMDLLAFLPVGDHWRVYGWPEAGWRSRTPSCANTNRATSSVPVWPTSSPPVSPSAANGSATC
ncbi:MAG TPA: outer membrane beta-barrel protein, partial [Burkholderiales bacterium]|nr:outer membrane beta-barrel protein [Burkholderiales bacterium]